MIKLSEVVGSASKVVSSALGLSWLPWAIAAAGIVGGTASGIWYRMQWKDCQADGAAALHEQREMDKRENSRAIAQLTNKLNANQEAYAQAWEKINAIPSVPTACADTPVMRAASDELWNLLSTGKTDRR